MAFRRVKKTYRKIAFLLLVCVVIGIWYQWKEYGGLSRLPAMQTVKAVATDQNVCALTLSLTGVESRVSLDLLASVCEGMELRPCIFVTTDWLHDNPELIPSLAFAELGLLFEDDPARWTKKRTMAFIASENERFMAMTGTFPRYVRLADKAPGSHASAALQSYGQTVIGFGATLADALSAGNIIDLGLLDGTTGYALARFCASSIANGYQIVSLSDLLVSTKA